MQITVYTKPGCDLCESFKAKLRDHLKVPFAEQDLESAVVISDTWREDKSPKFWSAWLALDSPVPFVRIDNFGYKYASALKEIKRRLKAGEVATMPEPERDKTFDKLGPPLTEQEFVIAVWELCDNNIGLMRVTSPVERTYVGDDGVVAQRIVQSEVNLWVHYRDAIAKPMCLCELRAVGMSLREALCDFKAKLDDAKTRGMVWSGVRGSQ
jgi:glutaredoxin